MRATAKLKRTGVRDGSIPIAPPLRGERVFDNINSWTHVYLCRDTCPARPSMHACPFHVVHAPDDAEKQNAINRLTQLILESEKLVPMMKDNDQQTMAIVVSFFFLLFMGSHACTLCLVITKFACDRCPCFLLAVSAIPSNPYVRSWMGLTSRLLLFENSVLSCFF